MRLRSCFMREVVRDMRTMGQGKALRCFWQVVDGGVVLAKTEERLHAERVQRALGRGVVERIEVAA